MPCSLTNFVWKLNKGVELLTTFGSSGQLYGDDCGNRTAGWWMPTNGQCKRICCLSTDHHQWPSIMHGRCTRSSSCRRCLDSAANSTWLGLRESVNAHLTTRYVNDAVDRLQPTPTFFAYFTFRESGVHRTPCFSHWTQHRVLKLARPVVIRVPIPMKLQQITADFWNKVVFCFPLPPQHCL